MDIAVAGVAGAALLNNPALRTLQVAFSALAGATIVVVGLQTLGLVPGQNIVNRVASRLWLGQFLGPILETFRQGGRPQGGRPQGSPLRAAFFLGLFNGFLPCGLVYSFALAAAATASLGSAMLTMLAFGLGTVPMLVAVGLGGAAIGSSALRPTLARASGVLVIALGALTVLRGTPLLTTFAAGGTQGHAAHGVMEMGAGYDLEPSPAPAFTLTNQDGLPVSLHDLHGKVMIMDFIYTSCTSTCPLLTATLRAVQQGLGADFARSVVLLSISVDPETDTPQVLKAYGEQWGADFSGWWFLTASREEIQSVTGQYAVFVERTADGLAHSEAILLIDGRGQLRSAHGLRTDPAVVIQTVQRLASESAH